MTQTWPSGRSASWELDREPQPKRLLQDAVKFSGERDGAIGYN
ncbi:hypothetical protein [Microcoleus sp. herbarium14]